MERVPVGATIGAIYNFVIQNFLVLLGIAWLPVVIRAAFTMYFILPISQAMSQAALTKNVAALGPAYGKFALFEVAAMALLLMVSVGMTRLALGHRPQTPFVFLTLGRDFWRLLLSSVVLGLLFIVLFFVASLLIGFLAAATGTLTSAGGAGVQLTVPLIIAGFIYLFALLLVVRFGLLLPSIVVAERGVGLGIGRAWTLTRGNSWRIVVVLLAVLVPLIILSVLELLVMTAMGGTSLSQAFSSTQAIMAWSQGLSARMSSAPYIYYPLSIVGGAISYGLIFGAGGFVYRALVPASGTQAAEVF